MLDSLIPMILGALISVIGILNIRGDIRSLHWYHRQRVSPEDVKPYGRLVGIGTLLCGAGCVVFGIFSLIANMIAMPLFTVMGGALLLVCVAIGLVIVFAAMFKYNKGIF